MDKIYTYFWPHTLKTALGNPSPEPSLNALKRFGYKKQEDTFLIDYKDPIPTYLADYIHVLNYAGYIEYTLKKGKEFTFVEIPQGTKVYHGFWGNPSERDGSNLFFGLYPTISIAILTETWKHYNFEKDEIARPQLILGHLKKPLKVYVVGKVDIYLNNYDLWSKRKKDLKELKDIDACIGTTSAVLHSKIDDPKTNTACFELYIQNYKEFVEFEDIIQIDVAAFIDSYSKPQNSVLDFLTNSQHFEKNNLGAFLTSGKLHDLLQSKNSARRSTQIAHQKHDKKKLTI